MMVPFLGRLNPVEYLALLVSFVLIGLEGFVRIITLALPSPIINLCYRTSRRLYNRLSSPTSRKSRTTKKKIVTSIAQASDFVELCELFGYSAEEHIVQTRDGYLLGLHRLARKKGEEYLLRVNSGKDSAQKKVVYLHHGLMMNSEVWVCLTDQERCLPFLLVERGYDVWLGNNRGNKYSKKSTICAPTDAKFWDFSIDQFAFHDIPDSIDYVLSTTHQPSLSYIGFSQGTAQAFAMLSIHPNLNDKVDVFIALAPAMSPPGLKKGVVNSFVKSSPEVLFLAFGRRALLSSATMWQALLYPPIFVRFIDLGLWFLFGWKTQNITPHQKLAAYPHLYSFTSTKSVVHWFQIIRNGKFQMYDDEIHGPWSITDGTRFYKVPTFPTRNIKTPIVLVYGGSDSLVEINVMLKELPKHTIAKEVPHYEHLDFLWAHDVHTEAFPHIFQALHDYAEPVSTGDHTTQSALALQPSADGFANSLTVSEEDTASSLPRKHTETTRKRSNMSQLDGTSSTFQSRARPEDIILPPAAPSSHKTDHTTASRPEGWWSSDEVAGTEPSTPLTKTSPSLSTDRLHLEDSPGETAKVIKKKISKSSFETASFGERGITFGKAGVVGGVSRGEVVGAGVGISVDGKKKKRRRKE